MSALTGYRFLIFIAVTSLVIVSQACQPEPGKKPIVALGPGEGTVRWLNPDCAKELGQGALLNVKIDRLSVPYTTMMAATQRLASSGIPVHFATVEPGHPPLNLPEKEFLKLVRKYGMDVPRAK